MEKIRTMIVDDEPLARRGIRAQLKEVKDIEIVSECRNGSEAVAAIEKHAPDLVFLDVQMPELDGFGVVSAVGVEYMPAVIFVTAYDRYALRAFDVHALDYLLKPYDDERFKKAVERARAQIKQKSFRRLSSKLESLLQDLESKGEPKYVERLAIKSMGRIVFLNVSEIDWIEAADNYVNIHSGRDSHLLRETLSSLENRLNPSRFLRIHRSAIVNVSRIKEARPSFRGEYRIVLRDGTRVSSGRTYRNELREVLLQSRER